MLRLQKKEITPNTEHAVKEVSTFVGMLSDYYKEDKEKGLDFGNQYQTGLGDGSNTGQFPGESCDS